MKLLTSNEELRMYLLGHFIEYGRVSSDEKGCFLEALQNAPKAELQEIVELAKRLGWAIVSR